MHWSFFLENENKPKTKLNVNGIGVNSLGREGSFFVSKRETFQMDEIDEGMKEKLISFNIFTRRMKWII